MILNSFIESIKNEICEKGKFSFPLPGFTCLCYLISLYIEYYTSILKGVFTKKGIYLIEN